MKHVNTPYKSPLETCWAPCTEQDDAVLLAALLAEFPISDLSLEAAEIHSHVLGCSVCREIFKDALISYLAQSIADASYEATQMDAFLGVTQSMSPPEQLRSAGCSPL